MQSAASRGVAVIAELKKASPSKGLIRADFPWPNWRGSWRRRAQPRFRCSPTSEYFQGSLQNLEIASKATRLPCLRKDFIVDEFQLLEARAHGADAILLIVAALEPS